MVGDPTRTASKIELPAYESTDGYRQMTLSPAFPVQVPENSAVLRPYSPLEVNLSTAVMPLWSKETHGVTVTRLDDAQVAEIKAKLAPMMDAYVKRVAQNGIDGQKLIDFLQKDEGNNK